MTTITLNDAEQFFYDHAGWSYNPWIETAEHGQARCAILLAHAEMLVSISDDVTVTWEDDDMPWQGDEPYDGPIYGAVIRKGNDPIGSLWGITFSEKGFDDPYKRVVEAELALEYL